MNKTRTIIVTLAAVAVLWISGWGPMPAFARETVKKSPPVADVNRSADLLSARKAAAKRADTRRSQRERDDYYYRHEFDQKPLPRLDRINLVGRDGVISENRRFTVELRADNSHTVNFRVIW